MPSPTAVVLDLGGVLMRSPSEEHVAVMAQLCGLEPGAFHEAWLAGRHAYDCDALTHEEYWRAFGIEDEARLARVLEADAESWATPEPAVGAWLERLREEGVRTGILSNMPREQWRRLGPLYERWTRGCETVVLSYEVGAAKPDEAIYRHCLRLLGLDPGQVLFVDDRADNVEAALALGLQALRFRDVAQLRDELAERYGDALPLPRAEAAASA